MAPPVVVIVGSTIVGVGLATAFHQYAWPHIRPHAQDIVNHCKARIQHTFKGIHKYHIRPPLSSSRGLSDGGMVAWAPTQFGEFVNAGSHTPLIVLQDESNTEKDANQTGLHRRQVRPRSESPLGSNLEMTQLDETYPLAAYTRISPTHTSTDSDLAGLDPFQEPSVPVSCAIPLPLSPPISAADSKPAEIPEPHTLPFTASQAMQNLSASSTSDRSSASSPVSVRRRLLNHSSTVPPNGGPIPSPNIPSQANTDARDSARRAMSPSGVSDTLSLISAAPSRTWTEGGTADIFSSDEQDFHGAEVDSEDDVRSVSESGSWESVSAADRNDGPSTADSQRAPRPL